MVDVRRIKRKTSMCNTAMLGIFMSVTLQAAVHLGKDYTENLRFTKNQLLKSVKQFFQVTEKLIKNQTEISGLTTIDYGQPTWRLATPLCDTAIEITNAKTYVFSDSVLCLGGISDQPVEAWKNKIKWYLETRHLKDLNRIDGEPMEIEWKKIPGFTTLGILEEVQTFMTELQCEPEQLYSCQCTPTVYGQNEETQTKCDVVRV